MDSVVSLAFPYSVSSPAKAGLVTLYVTDDNDTTRYAVKIKDGQCFQICHVYTDTLEPVGGRLQYVSDENPEGPLLLSVPSSRTRLKLELDIKGLDVSSNLDNNLLILKDYGPCLDLDDASELLNKGSESPTVDKSIIPFTKLTLGQPGSTRVLIGDSYDATKAVGKVLAVSLWSQTPSKTCEFLLSFKLYISGPYCSASASPLISNDPKFEPQLSELQDVSSKGLSAQLSDLNIKGMGAGLLKDTKDFNLSDLRKAFNFNIHDGPGFRKTLQLYENNTPQLKRAILTFQDEVRSLEACCKRLLSTRNRIIDVLQKVVQVQFNPLLEKLDIVKSFAQKFKLAFDHIEKIINFMVKDVFTQQSIPKMIAYCVSSQSSDYEPTSSRKVFEKQSKEFYDWLHKYLSNEKDRPELKLLLKRKNFELSKFDYLNFLNLTCNNQYLNQLFENILKFSSLPVTESGTLNYKLFLDNKKSQSLLNENSLVYLNGLSRFNSEKLQFRQMIESCRTNEELTNLIQRNPLNPSPEGKFNNFSQSKKSATPAKSHSDLPPIDFDLVFPNSLLITPPLAAKGTSLMDLDVDQNPNISGILYALGGQGKPGWHKEWVVLKKGQLMEFSDWRNGTQPINKPIDIALASVKPINKEKRQFCFEIITSHGQKHTFQAINNDERNQWIKALYNAGQLTDRLMKKQKPKLPGLADPLNIHRFEDRGSPVSIVSGSLYTVDDCLKSVRSIEDSDNNLCADCSSTESTEWLSCNFLVVVCLKCSSCHRNMGSHISKIKSLKLDNFFDENKVLLRHVNNRVANSYLEENVTDKIVANVTNEQRLRYINHKYEHRTFIKPIANLNSLLVESIQSLSIPNTIKYLNCGANPNINLQMSNPQWPEPITVSLFEYSLRKKVEVNEGSQKTEYFVFSELLLLHGYKLDQLGSLHPEIIDNNRAKTYWAKKRARIMGSEQNI